MDETKYQMGTAPKLLHPSRPPEPVPAEFFRTIYCWQDPQGCRWRFTFNPQTRTADDFAGEMAAHDRAHRENFAAELDEPVFDRLA